MSSAPGLFYAYARHSATGGNHRYMIVFANRATSDEWWRAVTDSVAAGYKRFEGVKRISPQFYTHDPNVNDGNIISTIEDEHCAGDFLGCVFFTQLTDWDARAISVAPVLNYVDHISGHGFFIRSSLQRDQYWLYDGQRIVVSRDNRTQFIISLVSSSQTNSQGSDGLVMIGTDRVFISLSKGNRFVNMNSDRSLSISHEVQEGLLIKFSQFNGGFEIGFAYNEVLVSGQQGVGDRWELA